MERTPYPGGEQYNVNSYGTDDPAKQAEIEAARAAASRERERDRARLEQMVESGIDPDDAEAVIEFDHMMRDEQTHRVEGRIGDGSSLEAIEPAAPETSERPHRYQPHVYVSDDASLARGIQHGLWLDADKDPDALDADIAAMLDSSPTVGAEAWTVRASRDFAGILLRALSTTERIAQLGQGVAEYGEAFAAYLDWVGLHDPDALEQFNDHYMGTYRSMTEWGKQVAEDLEWPQQIQQKLDDDLAQYVEIDYARWAREAAHWWHVVEGDNGVHVFAP